MKLPFGIKLAILGGFEPVFEVREIRALGRKKTPGKLISRHPKLDDASAVFLSRTAKGGLYEIVMVATMARAGEIRKRTARIAAPTTPTNPE